MQYMYVYSVYILESMYQYRQRREIVGRMMDQWSMRGKRGNENIRQ